MRKNAYFFLQFYLFFTIIQKTKNNLNKLKFNHLPKNNYKLQ